MHFSDPFAHPTAQLCLLRAPPPTLHLVTTRRPLRQQHVDFAQLLLCSSRGFTHLLGTSRCGSFFGATPPLRLRALHVLLALIPLRRPTCACSRSANLSFSDCDTLMRSQAPHSLPQRSSSRPAPPRSPPTEAGLAVNYEQRW